MNPDLFATGNRVLGFPPTGHVVNWRSRVGRMPTMNAIIAAAYTEVELVEAWCICGWRESFGTTGEAVMASIAHRKANA